MSRYICHKCEAEHGTDNMVAYCAACYSDLRAKLAAEKERAEKSRANAMKAALDGLEQFKAQYHKNAADLLAENAALTEKVAAGWAAFRTYGGHAEQCFQMTGRPCSCGFDRVASESGRVLRAHDAATQKELLEVLREWSQTVDDMGWHKDRGVAKRTNAILAKYAGQSKEAEGE